MSHRRLVCGRLQNERRERTALREKRRQRAVFKIQEMSVLLREIRGVLLTEKEGGEAVETQLKGARCDKVCQKKAINESLNHLQRVSKKFGVSSET